MAKQKIKYNTIAFTESSSFETNSFSIKREKVKLRKYKSEISSSSDFCPESEPITLPIMDK